MVKHADVCATCTRHILVLLHIPCVTAPTNISLFPNCNTRYFYSVYNNNDLRQVRQQQHVPLLQLLRQTGLHVFTITCTMMSYKPLHQHCLPLKAWQTTDRNTCKSNQTSRGTCTWLSLRQKQIFKISLEHCNTHGIKHVHFNIRTLSVRWNTMPGQESIISSQMNVITRIWEHLELLMSVGGSIETLRMWKLII